MWLDALHRRLVVASVATAGVLLSLSWSLTRDSALAREDGLLERNLTAMHAGLARIEAQGLRAEASQQASLARLSDELGAAEGRWRQGEQRIEEALRGMGERDAELAGALRTARRDWARLTARQQELTARQVGLLERAEALELRFSALEQAQADSARALAAARGAAEAAAARAQRAEAQLAGLVGRVAALERSGLPAPGQGGAGRVAAGPDPRVAWEQRALILRHNLSEYRALSQRLAGLGAPGGWVPRSGACRALASLDRQVSDRPPRLRSGAEPALRQLAVEVAELEATEEQWLIGVGWLQNRCSLRLPVARRELVRLWAGLDGAI